MTNVKFIILILYTSLIYSKKVNAQKLEAKIGFGNYEAFNIGLRHNYNKLSIEYGYGNDLNIYNQGFYNAVHFGVAKAVLKKIIPKNNCVFVQAKTLLWNIENQSNIFSAVSFSTELMNKTKLTKQCQLGFYGGILWSSVFRYKRKSYTEIGFPKEWQPNFGLSLFYNIQ